METTYTFLNAIHDSLHYFLPRPAQTAAANPIHIFVRGSGHKPAAVCALVEQAHEFRQEDVGDPRVALEHKHVLVVHGKQLQDVES